MKICECCGAEFSTNRKFCSMKCAAIMRNKKRWNDPEYRRNYFQTVHSDEYRKKCSDNSKELWKKPGHREQVIKSWRETFNSSDNTRLLISENSKRMWEDAAKKKEISEKIKESLNTDEMKEWRSNLMIEKWKNNEYAKIWLKQCFTYKDYVMPSGNVVKIQGYEPQVLDELLQKYEEPDIYIGKHIENVLGKIFYDYNNKKRRYFPDFYIKSTNTIIEVKSTYTFELHREKNLAKEQACLQHGFNFEFRIIKNKVLNG